MSEELAKVEPNNTNTSIVTSTLKPESAEDAARLANAMNASLSLADLGNDAELELADILVMPGKRESREHPGEFLNCENTYLITSDGTSYFSQSAGIARSAKNLSVMIDMLKAGSDSVPVKVISQPTQKGNVKSLMVVRRSK